MRKLKTALILVASLFWSGGISAAIRPPEAGDAVPVVDGSLDEPAWSRAAELRLAQTALPLQPPVSGTQTTLRLLLQDGRLFLAADCRFPEGRTPVAELREHDAPVFEDDSLELFFAPVGTDPAPVYHLAVNAAGVASDRKDGDPGWNPDWRHAVAVGADRWTLELELPLSALADGHDASGLCWRFNACRNLYRADGSFEQGWVRTRPGYHAPSELLFAGPVAAAHLLAAVQATLAEMTPFQTSLTGAVAEQWEELRAIRSWLEKQPEARIPEAEAEDMLARAARNAGRMETVILLEHMFATD